MKTTTKLGENIEGNVTKLTIDGQHRNVRLPPPGDVFRYTGVVCHILGKIKQYLILLFMFLQT